MNVSPDGRFVAVRTGSSSQAGGPLFVGPVAGPLTQVGAQVGYSTKFSADSNWVVFVDDHSNSSGGGLETLKARSLVTGITSTLGQGLQISADVSISPSNRVFFIDQFSYAAGVGRLRSHDLTAGTGVTLDTAAYQFELSSTGSALAWMTNYSIATRTADLKMTSLPTMSISTIGTQVALQCAHFTEAGNAFVFLDGVTSSANPVGRLRSRTSNGIVYTVAPQARTDQSWCFVASRDGTRLIYLTSHANSAGTAFWVPVVGGPSIPMGNAVGYRRLSYFSDASAIEYLDAYVDGFNTDYGTMTFLRAGQSPVTIATNVYGRYNTLVPSGLLSIFASNYDFALGRGTLNLLNHTTGQMTQLATNAHEWAEFAPDTSKALILAEHAESTTSARLEIVDLPNGTNKRVITTSAQNYRYEFKDPTHISYVANWTGMFGNVTYEDVANGGAQIIASTSTIFMSDRVDAQRQAFTMLTSSVSTSPPGTLRVVRISDGANAVVDFSVSTKVEWATGNRLLYEKSGELWTKTVTWQ